MSSKTSALTPDALAMLDTIARNGSFAAAARELGRAPSALTYSVRQLEDALDVLLFDRRSGQAEFTAAGQELLREARRLLADLETVANRVQRVASGWEQQFTIAADGLISRTTLFELCEAFYALRPNHDDSGPGTQLRLRTEVLVGTWEALITGQADLAVGVVLNAASPPPGVEAAVLGEVPFVFIVAPHHPLAALPEPLGDELLIQHRAIAVADSARQHTPYTVNLLPGQDVLTVPTLHAKLEAQLRGLGCGFLPEPLARAHIEAGRLVVKATTRGEHLPKIGYAWRSAAAPTPKGPPRGSALGWWLEQLKRPATRRALLERHSGVLLSVE
jgi:molybdate transport repressor ModE-like protein